MVAGTLGVGKEWLSVLTKRWCSCLKEFSFCSSFRLQIFLFCVVSLSGFRFTLRGKILLMSGKCKVVLESLYPEFLFFLLMSGWEKTVETFIKFHGDVAPPPKNNLI